MRKSSTKSRLAIAGITTGAVAAALFLSPTAALAADVAATSAPGGGPTGVTVTLTGSTMLTGITGPLGGLFVPTGTSCPTTYSTTTTGAVTATPTKVDDNSATVVVPTTLTLNSTRRGRTTFASTPERRPVPAPSPATPPTS
jgi:hypothetical protein